MYYGLIILAVIMFGGCFAINDICSQKFGSSMKVSLQFTLVSSFAGLIALLFINGLKFEFTIFTMVMALLASLMSVGFAFCSFRALGSINLSLYSLFSMLGGMALPFVQGIVFYGENITFAKILCFIVICIALMLTVERGVKKSGTIYYVGIFVINGMSGVLSKYFAEAPFEKTSAEGYSILIALCTAVLALLTLIAFYRKDGFKFSGISVALGSAAGIVNKLANLWLVIALSFVDASVQYPMVTGGVMIISTIICYFGKKKPSQREILSVLVAFVGMLCLLIPA